MGSWSRCLDVFPITSFDRRGYRRRAAAFSVEPTRDLSGRRVLITGGTRGIGLAIAQGLRGADVILWGRDAASGGAAAADLGATFTSVDLGDLRAVAAAAEALAASGPLDAVVLNAGGMPLSRRLTPQGHELIWASQVLGHVLLLRVLRARGALAPGCRVVWMSSGGMLLVPLDLRDLRRDRGYARHGVYANAKRAQVLLAAHLHQAWPDVWQASMHPGWVATDAVSVAMPWFDRVMGPWLRTAEEGADTAVWLVSRDVPPPGGGFWLDRAPWPIDPLPWTPTPQRAVDALVAAVWHDTDRYVAGPTGPASP